MQSNHDPADLLGPATLRAYSALAQLADDTAQAHARYMTPAPEAERKFNLRDFILEPPRRSPPTRIICDSPWLSITIGNTDGGQ
ncbi:hypothetical protein C5688_13600 [Methylocystis sp. MitZ-2018]|nr:hypothetical protein C5688_13600 [Methylocystis sp. MitZ-2018]